LLVRRPTKAVCQATNKGGVARPTKAVSGDGQQKKEAPGFQLSRASITSDPQGPEFNGR